MAAERDKKKTRADETLERLRAAGLDARDVTAPEGSGSRVIFLGAPPLAHKPPEKKRS